MARRIRVEVEGGLYHVITRGVDRQDIFHSPEDFARFIGLLTFQKERLPFYLYAYCLMTNHIHLLIERRTDNIGRIMQRVLTGYAQYYNRRYKRTGHVLQGRHKAILCESETYLAELVRYIHLNPVRAKMVRQAKSYPYSSHRAYIGLEPAVLVDTDPVLRLFAVRKKLAVQRFDEYVKAGAKLPSDDRFYDTECGILGSDEFVDHTIHRIGEHDTFAAARRRKESKASRPCDARALITAIEIVFGISKEDICSRSKASYIVDAKEALILTGHQLGLSLAEMSDMIGLNASTVTRRHDSARRRVAEDPVMAKAVDNVMKQYGLH